MREIRKTIRTEVDRNFIFLLLLDMIAKDDHTIDSLRLELQKGKDGFSVRGGRVRKWVETLLQNEWISVAGRKKDRTNYSNPFYDLTEKGEEYRLLLSQQTKEYS